MRKPLLSFLILFSAFAQAQVLINEVASTNSGYFADEDGDNPDWIELYNAGSAAVDLTGYGLTDNGNWNQWQFPDTSIAANGRMIIYASGKNRNCLTCPVSPVNHWETAVAEDDTWQYMIGTSEPPANWNSTAFTAVWSTGEGGFGFGDGDDHTPTAVGYPYYYRKEFTIPDKSKIIKTLLSMDYDDGFVAYINDVEIARKNITGTPTHSTSANYWHEALMYGGDNPLTIEIDSALMASLLVDGENVLAVEMHDYTSDDMSGRTWLHFGISTPDVFFPAPPAWFSNPGTAPDLHTNFKITNNETIAFYNAEGILIDSIATSNLQADHVLQRIPDAGGWCYSDQPTPAAINAGACYAGYAETPEIITPPGFYDAAVTVEISGDEIYYTTDGSKPNTSAELYISPVGITATGVIKAVQVQAGKLPSAVATGSYFIDEATTLPVVSIVADPCNLFLEDPDCIAAYDNAEGWFNRNPIVPVTVEYFDTARVQQFVNDFKFECVGNYSVSLPQKSMRFVIDEDYGSGPDVTYNIFEKDKPGLPFIHGFRVRNMDQDYYGSRMKDIIVNRIGLPTHSLSTAYQNVAVFINGAYWGLYGAREEMDEYFLRDNFGVDPEKVDLMKTGWGGEEKTIAEAGSDTGYYALIDFIKGNDMADPVNYAMAKNEVDVENWVDYFATEMYVESSEWLSWLENNIRLFRSHEPDIKWRYMLWDCSNSQFSPNDNMLAATLDNINFSVYADMFNALLENTEFHDYFINRFADLMNYYFTEEKDHAIIAYLEDEMGPEIGAQNAEWGTGNFSSWSNSVDDLYDFYTARNMYQRNHIEDYFDLDDQVNITLEVNPPGAGFIKISTIVPQELPWTGVYFDGVPVTLTAIANPGYTFSNWEDNTYIDDPLLLSFTKNITGNTTCTANFTGSAIANPVIISEVNYNSDSSINAGDWIELHNTADIAIDISAYTFSDKYFYNHFEIPAQTIIPAHGYFIIAEDSLQFNTQHPGIEYITGDFHFSLQNDSDFVVLKDMQNTVLSQFTYHDHRPWPFTADGYGRTMERNSDAADPALASSWFEGCIGGSPGAAYSACNENPLVDEINYKSSLTADADDWFELYNGDAAYFDLGGWSFMDKNGNIFFIPEGTGIPAHDYLVFYQDDIKFSSRFPYVTNKLGPINFGFDGNGDVILLYDDSGKLFQSAGFDDAFPYPLSPDGGGTTLQIVNTAENINDPYNWTASCPEGTPGSAYVTPCEVTIADIAQTTLYIYPNPASGFIIIGGIAEPIGNLLITDISGKIVLKKDIRYPADLSIDVAAFTAGIYFLQYTAGDFSYTVNFIRSN